MEYLSFNDSVWHEGPVMTEELVYPCEGACAVELNSSTTLVIGGQTSTGLILDSTLAFDWKEMAWKEMAPRMKVWQKLWAKLLTLLIFST